MPLNKEFYTGTNENPLIVIPEVLSDGKMYYKIEVKHDMGSPFPDSSIGDAFNIAKDILKISNPIFTSISLSVGFADRLYTLTQESHAKQELNPDLDMQTEYAANIANATVSTIVSVYGGGEIGTRILKTILKDSPLLNTISRKITGDIGNDAGDYVAKKVRNLLENEDFIKDDTNDFETFESYENNEYQTTDSQGNETTVNTKTGEVESTLADGTKINNSENKTSVEFEDGSSRVFENTSNGYQTTSLDRDGNITYITDSNQSITLSKSELTTKEQVQSFLDDSGLSDKISVDEVLAANGYTNKSQIPSDAVLKTPQLSIDIEDGNSSIKLYIDNSGTETYIVDGIAYRVEYGNNGIIGEPKNVVAVTKINPDGSSETSLVLPNGELKEIYRNANGKVVSERIEFTYEEVAVLQDRQTISDISSHTSFTSNELLEYNNHSSEDAKSLPIGFEVQIPKEIHTTIGEYGEIKIYENFDNGGTIFAPLKDGTKNIITYDENSDLLIQGNITSPTQISWSNTDGSFEVWSKDSNGNMYQSQITTSEGDTTNYVIDENGIKHKINIDDNQTNSDANNMEEQLDNQELPNINKDELEANSDQIKNDANTTEEDSILVENPDFSKVTTTAINQIGSLIISNNDFSNIEEISITASVATLADYAIYEEAKEFKTTEEGFENLKGAVASFAISSYFAKNDNISDLIGADGTFLGDFALNICNEKDSYAC